ncbi:MAG: choice-of-anchor J domain-containing protein [Opitutales bacterium]|nr:choice-of-anchor J domain-containing protein [Opitutales bacterium]
MKTRIFKNAVLRATLFTVLIAQSFAQDEVVLFENALRDGNEPTGWEFNEVVFVAAAGGYARLGTLDSFLASPSFDATPFESFRVLYSVAKFGAGGDGPVSLEFSTDGGATWDFAGNSPIPLDGNTYLNASVEFDVEAEQIRFRFTRPASPSQKRLRDVTIIGITRDASEPVGPPAAFPANFTATIVGANAVRLEWTDVALDPEPRGYWIFADSAGMPAAPVDGTPPTADTDFSDGAGAVSITQGTEFVVLRGFPLESTVNFSIHPFTNTGANILFPASGTAPSLTVNLPTILEAQPFDDFGDWIVRTVENDTDWFINATLGQAEGNSFNNNGPADTWLISPPVEVIGGSSVFLEFASNFGFSDTGLERTLEVLVSFDYDGEGDPLEATWFDLDPLLATGATPVVTPPVELNSFGTGTAYIAFRYLSSGNASGASARWRIDDVFIFSSEPPPPVRRINLSLLPAEVLETDGANAATLTLALTDDPDAYPLTVFLESSDPAAVSLPASVSMTSRTLQVPVGVVADGVFTGDRTVVISAEAEGFPGLPASLLIRETDPRPEITLSLSTLLVFDDAGANAVTGTLTLSAAPAAGYPFAVTIAADPGGILNLPEIVVFASGLSANFPIGVISGSATAGPQTIDLTAAADPYLSGSAQLEVRAATAAGLPALGLVLPTRLREGSSGQGFVFLSTPAAGAVEVLLTSGDATEIAVPASVTVPAGSAVASFSVQALTDGIVDGDQVVTVIAAAEGYATATATLVVEDADRPRFLELIPATASLDEGQQMVVRVRLSEPPGVGRNLTLTASDPRLLLPNTVPVQAEDTEVTFFVTAMDDGFFGPDRTVLLTARVDGYVPAEASITIRNIQLAPALLLSLTPAVVFDNAGADLPRARLSLTSLPVTGFPVVVTLSAEPQGVLNLPLDVELESLAERLLPIGVLPGAAAGGPIEVTVTASAPGLSPVSAGVTVRPAIVTPDVALEITAPTRLREGETAEVTVRLPDAPGIPVTVNLSSSDTTELVVDSPSKTIAADSSFVTFEVTAVTDGVVDGDQTVTLLATAVGFAATTATVVVEDVDLTPEMVLTASTSSVNAGGSLFVTARLNISPGEARTLRLRTNDSRLNVPAEVPVGGAAVDVVFLARAPAQPTFQPNRTVRIVAELEGYPSAELDIEVSNTVPRAVFLRPFDGQTFAVGQSVSIELNVAGPFDGLQEVIFLINGAPRATFTRPPFRAELSFDDLGPRILRAVVRDRNLGDFETPAIELEVIFNPAVNNRDFLVQTYLDLFNSEPVEPAFSIYLDRLRTGQMTRAEVVEQMVQGATYRRIVEAISIHHMLLGRPMSWEEFFVEELPLFSIFDPDLGFLTFRVTGWNNFVYTRENLFLDSLGQQPGGFLGLAYYVLNYSPEFPIAVGGNPEDLTQVDFFRYLWHHRHGVEPTAQQQVQANFRVTTYKNNQAAPHTRLDPLNYARARLAAGLARGDRIGGLDIIYNPPNEHWRDYARGAALFMSLWRGNRELGVPAYGFSYAEALAAGQRPLIGFIEELLWSPRYGDRFGHGFLGASRMTESGWHRSSWLGWFHYETHTFPWVYHGSGVWLYAASARESAEATWVWHPEMGWIWTSERAYPFAYQAGHGWVDAPF